jgi:hypothetical protein
VTRNASRPRSLFQDRHQIVVMISRLRATAAVTLILVGCGGAGPHSVDPVSVTSTRLNLSVPRGAYHLEVGNPGDLQASYSLTVQYLAPSI